jgi:hypothetical protein
MGLRPTQGDEKRLLFSNYAPREHSFFPLSSRPKRSVVERSAVQRSFLEMVFDRASRIPTTRCRLAPALVQVKLDKNSTPI